MRPIPLLLFAALLAAPACQKLEPRAEVEAREKQQASRDRRTRAVCASQASYERLKALAFEKARDVRGDDAPLLDRLAASTVVRMEEPVVKSRDEALNVTVCSGTLVIDLPPGTENAFDGDRRLEAEVEYAAQAAADGSGLVYSLDGADPIIVRLAAFGLKNAGDARLAAAEPATQSDPAAADTAAPAPPVVAAPAPPAPRRQDKVRPAPTESARADAPPPPPPRAASARPSFNCRYARSRSEKMVCSDERLAARDRAMSSQFYRALAVADGGTRRELRRTRDDFLVARDRCSTSACIAAAYERRMDEIDDIMSDL